jgi:hypothetical protein
MWMFHFVVSGPVAQILELAYALTDRCYALHIQYLPHKEFLVVGEQ